MKKLYFFLILSILCALNINANSISIYNNTNNDFSINNSLSDDYGNYLNDSLPNRDKYRNNPDYTGDVNAEAQRICFDNTNFQYRYSANTNLNYANILDSGIDFGVDPNTYELIAPSWFYIEPTTTDNFSIKITKEISLGEGNNIDYICFKVPKTEDPKALTHALTGSSNIFSSNLQVEYDGSTPPNALNYVEITFNDDNLNYNYVLVVFNMKKDYNATTPPTANLLFELIDPNLKNFKATVYVNTTKICEGESFTITGHPDNPGDTKYSWEIKNGGVGNANPVIETIEGSPATYTPAAGITKIGIRSIVSYDPGYLCNVLEKKTTTTMGGAKVVNISSSPTANFSWDVTDPCPNTDITFTAADNVAGNTYTWDFGDGSGTTTGSSVKHQYSNEGDYTVKLTVENGTCSAEETKIISVSSGLSVDFTFDPDPALVNSPVTFTIVGYNPSYTYTWGSSAFSGPKPITGNTWTHTFTSTGTYDVTLYATASGCPGQITKPVIVSNCGHAATFTITPETLCYGELFTCKVDNPIAGAFYEWDYNGGSKITGYNKDTYDQTLYTAGPITINLKMTVDGCEVIHSTNVIVNPCRFFDISVHDPNTSANLKYDPTTNPETIPAVCEWSDCHPHTIASQTACPLSPAHRYIITYFAHAHCHLPDHVQ